MPDEALFEVGGRVQRVDAMVRELHKTEGWPVDPEKDRALIAELVEQYPTLDLAEEFSKFRVWLMQQPPKEREKRVKSRGRLSTIRNWCARAVNRKPPRSASVGPRRTSTAARPADAFGETSQSLGRW